MARRDPEDRGPSLRGWRRGVAAFAAGIAAVLALGTVACGPWTHRAYVTTAPYAEAPLPREAKIFLVAGGVDVANFAAEVIEQRAHWRAQGFTDAEIACYYAKPSVAGFRGDRRQFRRLLPELDGCYPASTGLLRRHLVATAAEAPPFIYLYLTSHGVDRLVAADSELPPDERALLDRYVIQLGAGPGEGLDAAAILAAYRGGVPREELLWTPELLGDLLAAFPAATAKIVILQGCHSGGFLADPRGRAAAIQASPNLTAIASARHDRTSFGCDPGPERTFFGALFALVLRELGTGKAPPEIPWEALFHQLARLLAKLEARTEVRPSLPVFFTTASGTGDHPRGLP